MFVGMAFFLVVTTFVPEPDFADTVVEVVIPPVYRGVPRADGGAGG